MKCWMQLGSAGTVIPRSKYREEPCWGTRKFHFCCSKGRRQAYYSLFTRNLVLSEEFLYKFKLMKYLWFVIFQILQKYLFVKHWIWLVNHESRVANSNPEFNWMKCCGMKYRLLKFMLCCIIHMVYSENMAHT